MDSVMTLYVITLSIEDRFVKAISKIFFYIRLLDFIIYKLHKSYTSILDNIGYWPWRGQYQPSVFWPNPLFQELGSYLRVNSTGNNVYMS